MDNDFSEIPYIFAFEASSVERLREYNELHGRDLPLNAGAGGSKMTKTLLGGFGGAPGVGLQAMRFEAGDVSRADLTDGRVAFSGHWSKSFVAAVKAGEIDAEMLDNSEFDALRAQPEELS